MPLQLLDTHTLIWFINGDKQLSLAAKGAIESDEAVNYVSVASIWEIAIKISLGKLALNKPFSEINKQMEINNFKLLMIEIEDALMVANLPFYHRDPFDRLLAVQSIRNGLKLITKDELFKPYGVSVFW